MRRSLFKLDFRTEDVGRFTPKKPVSLLKIDARSSFTGWLNDTKPPLRRPVAVQHLSTLGELQDGYPVLGVPVRREVLKSIARTLYVSRPLLNAEEVIAWAKSVGFSTCLPPEDMHVTVTYSKNPVDWDLVQISAKAVAVPPSVAGLGRYIEQFNKGAVVLQFQSPALTDRWQELKNLGAMWKYPDYKSHVTLTYDPPEDLDLGAIVPYPGMLKFGPEVFAEIVDGGFDETKIVEKGGVGSGIKGHVTIRDQNDRKQVGAFLHLKETPLFFVGVDPEGKNRWFAKDKYDCEVKNDILLIYKKQAVQSVAQAAQTPVQNKYADFQQKLDALPDNLSGIKMTRLGAGDSGINESYTFEYNGQKYFAKNTTSYGDPGQELVAFKIAGTMGLNVTPAVMKGNLIVTPFVEGKPASKDNGTAYKIIGAMSAADLTRELAGQYLIGDSDRHAGNFMTTDGGTKVLDIDFGGAFRASDRRALSGNFMSKVVSHVNRSTASLDAGVLQGLISSRGNIMDIVANSGNVSGDSMNNMLGRFDRLKWACITQATDFRGFAYPMINIWWRDELVASVYLEDGKITVIDRDPPSDIVKFLTDLQGDTPDTEFYNSLPVRLCGQLWAGYVHDPADYPGPGDIVESA